MHGDAVCADVERAAFRKRVVDEYLGLSNPRRDGRSAIITAGAPGAGKSGLLAEQVPDLAEYRVLDADIVKEYLIKQALEDGIYDDLLNYPLADGDPLAPRELAPLVHNESVRLIDQIRRICGSLRENIVIEGTLIWPGQGPTLFAELAEDDYASVCVFGMEVDKKVAHEQALSRWWTGRKQWTDGDHPLGGRFAPPAVIETCYTGGDLSRCAQNALHVIDLAQSGEIPKVRVTIFRRSSTGAIDTFIDRHYQR